MANAVPFTLITPRATVFEGDAEFVIVTGTEGEVGILPSHAPFLTALKPGVLRANVRDGSGIMRMELACGEGFLQALPGKITVLTDAAYAANEVDVSTSREELAARAARAARGRQRSRRPGSAHSPKSNSPALSSRSSASRADAMIPRKIGVTNGLFAEHPVLPGVARAVSRRALSAKSGSRRPRTRLIDILADCDGAIVGPRADQRARSLPPCRSSKSSANSASAVRCSTSTRCANMRSSSAFTPGTNRLAVAELTLCLYDRRACAG